MGHRNMLCPIDLEIEHRGQGYLHHEPCIFLGGITNYPSPDIQVAITAPGNATNLDTHPLPEHYDNGIYYGMSQYPGVQHHRHSPNLDLGIGTNFYVPYVATPSSSVPINHGIADQMPSSSNYRPLGVSADEYARNCHFMDNVRGSYKIKSSEGIPGNFPHLNASSSSSSSVTPLNTRNPDGVGTVDSASFTMSQYRGHGPPPIREVGSQRSARNRLGATAVDPVLMQSANHFFHGNYLGQPFQPSITDGGASAWTQAPPPPGVPFMHGSNIGPMETRHRSSTNFSHSPIDLRNPNFHHPAPPIEGSRGHSINVHPQVAAVPYCFPASFPSQSTMNPSQDGLDVGRRHFGPAPPTGFRIYHSRRESGTLPETSLRHRNLPHLRVLPPDGVAVLEFPEFYEEVGNLTDHHRDMRLDIEDMSYEELLALGDRIGKVNTGLSDEIIRRKLKTRSYSTLATNINLEEAASVEQEPDFCTICQEDYKNQEKIGTLDCGHEYHASCLRKWLVVKNVCPICKSEALAT